MNPISVPQDYGQVAHSHSSVNIVNNNVHQSQEPLQVSAQPLPQVLVQEPFAPQDHLQSADGTFHRADDGHIYVVPDPRSHGTNYKTKFNNSCISLMVNLVAENGAKKKIRCMLDNCSNLSILLKSVADQLDMTGPNIDLAMSTTGHGSCLFKKQKVVKFRLEALDESYITPFEIEAPTAPAIARDFPKINLDPTNLEYLQGITFTEKYPMSENYYKKTKQISLLLGLPYESHIIKSTPKHGPSLDYPSVIFTYLGNSLTGDIPELSQTQNVTFHTLKNNVCEQCGKKCDAKIPNMVDFLRLDNMGISDPSLQNDITYDEFHAQKQIESGSRDHMFSMITKSVSVRNETRPLALNISVEVPLAAMFIRALVSKLCSTTIISAMFSVIHLEFT